MILYGDIKPDPKPGLKTQLELAKTEAVPPKRDVATVREITPVRFREPEPLTLNTARILDITRRILAYWGRWDNEAWLDVSTLWIASTWFADENQRLLFTAHPRLFAIAPKGSGKTRYMKLVRALSRNPTGIVKAPVTAPGVREALLGGRTVFLDELHRQIGTGRAHADLQSVISAYEADTGSLNARGGYNEQSIFGPMMLAAQPVIMTATSGLVDDLFERSFILAPGRSRDKIPDLNQEFEFAVEPMRKIFQLWGESVRPGPDDDRHLWPVHSMPERLDSRMREISQPLLAVADRAVDPDVIDAKGEDLRWAIAGRAAVQNVLLGHGENGAEILEDVTGRLRSLGIEL
jgi:hypothetical protein